MTPPTGTTAGPDDVLTQYNIACVLIQLGDHDSDFDALRALPRYQRVLELIR